MKKHNALKVIFITLAVFLLLSWILPVAVFQAAYSEQGRVQMGLFDIFSYQTTALSYFGQLSLFVLVVGGFYGVLNKTGVYRKMLDKIAKAFKRKEWLALSIIMVIFAVLSSICGLQMGLIALFPFVISLVLLMGYNKLTAIAVTVGSTVVGIMGTTFATSTTNVLTQYLSLEITNQIWAKVIILVLGLAILILNVVLFGKKQNKKVAEDKDEFVPAAIRGRGNNKKVWPLVVILDVMFLVMILAFIPWNTAFGLTVFDEVTSAVTGWAIYAWIPLALLFILVNVVLLLKKKYIPTIVVDSAVVVIVILAIILSGWSSVWKALITPFPIFGKLFGTMSSFGNWSIGELCTLLLLGGVVLKFVYNIKWEDVLESFMEGAKKAMLPAAIIVLIYSGLVITTYHPFQLVIYKFILDLTAGFNIFTSGVVALLAGLFNVEPAYAFQSVVPYLSSLITDQGLYSLIAVIFQSLYAVAMLIAPTSVALMITLAYLKVSYKDWMKYIWKILLEIIVVLFIIFTILLLI